MGGKAATDVVVVPIDSSLLGFEVEVAIAVAASQSDWNAVVVRVVFRRNRGVAHGRQPQSVFLRGRLGRFSGRTFDVARSSSG